jgi:hypothetical protein
LIMAPGAVWAQPAKVCNAPIGDGLDSTAANCKVLTNDQLKNCPSPEAPLDPGTIGEREACLATCDVKLNSCLKKCSPVLSHADECVRGMFIRLKECLGKAKTGAATAACYAAWARDYSACSVDVNFNLSCNASCYIGYSTCAFACSDPSGCLKWLLDKGLGAFK